MMTNKTLWKHKHIAQWWSNVQWLNVLLYFFLLKYVCRFMLHVLILISYMSYVLWLKLKIKLEHYSFGQNCSIMLWVQNWSNFSLQWNHFNLLNLYQFYARKKLVEQRKKFKLIFMFCRGLRCILHAAISSQTIGISCLLFLFSRRKHLLCAVQQHIMGTFAIRLGTISGFGILGIGDYPRKVFPCRAWLVPRLFSV